MSLLFDGPFSHPLKVNLFELLMLLLITSLFRIFLVQYKLAVVGAKPPKCWDETSMRQNLRNSLFGIVFNQEQISIMHSNVHRLRQIISLRSRHFHCVWSATACGSMRLKLYYKVKISLLCPAAT